MLTTLGHSTLDRDQFLALLTAAAPDLVLDVRSHPLSSLEYFCQPNLASWLTAAGYACEHWPALGGWSARHLRWASAFAKAGVDVAAYAGDRYPRAYAAQPRPARSRRPEWTVRGLYDFSWFTILPDFLDAADRLVALATTKRICLLGAELVWWRCTRGLVADYLLWRGVDATHFQPKRTNHLAAVGDRLDRYELFIAETWVKDYAARRARPAGGGTQASSPVIGST